MELFVTGRKIEVMQYVGGRQKADVLKILYTNKCCSGFSNKLEMQ
jgi:hypothetical protein